MTLRTTTERHRRTIAMGGKFYQLRDWSDADWIAARQHQGADKDKAARSATP